MWHLNKVSIVFSILTLLPACGNPGGADRQNSPNTHEAKDSELPDNGIPVRKKVSDLKLAALYAGELPMTAQASLLEGIPKKSAAFCDVRNKVSEIKTSIISASPEKFCDGSDINIDTKYNVTVKFDSGSTDTYKFFIHQTDVNSYQITYCREDIVATSALLKTPGDGTGSVHSLTVSDTMAYYYKFAKSNSVDGIIQMESGQNRPLGEKKEALQQKIEFDGKSGHFSLSWYSDVPPEGAEKYVYFTRSLTKFDPSFGHMLRLGGYPLDEDELNHNIRKEEFFDANGIMVDEAAASQFLEGGSLTIDATELPPILDHGLGIEEISTWNCQGIDEEITLSCTLKSAQDDSGSGDCGTE